MDKNMQEETETIAEEVENIISETEIQNDTDSITQEEETLNQLNLLMQENEALKDMAKRAQADFVNYKKRVEKEKHDISSFANERIMLELIEVMDNFERALTSEYEEANSGFYQGVQMIFKQLKDKLEKFGLKEIDALDQDFDPNFHHAVLQVEGDEPGKVKEVLQRGYTIKDKILRPAMVKVSM